MEIPIRVEDAVLNSTLYLLVPRRRVVIQDEAGRVIAEEDEPLEAWAKRCAVIVNVKM